MAFQRPSLTAIIDRIKGDIISLLGLQTILRRSLLDVLAKALGGAAHVLHGHLDFLSKQLLPDTAEDEFLVRWGVIFGVERLPATFAKLNIKITGTDSTVIPINTIFQRSDGFEYTTEAEVIIGSTTTGEVDAVIVASEAGENGNLDDASIVSLTSPIAGADSDATVISTNTEGEDEETIENLRTRVIERIQAPPQGGAVADYIAFAKTVVSVTRVWVLPGFLGEGSVGVTFVEDGNAPASIIPAPAKVTEVQDAIDPLKPITADVTVFAPIEVPLDLTISMTPNTTAVQNAVTEEIRDLILREAQVKGAFKEVGVSYTGRIALSKISEAISTAAGEDEHVIVSPTSDPQAGDGGILTLGTITFQTLVP